MEWELIIKNGTIVTHEEKYEANLYIKDGKISVISTEDLGEGKRVIDAKGKYVLPGLIDTHVHSRDGGATHKEDFYHSTLSAAAGGITTVFEMPNTNPPVNNEENFNQQLENLSSKANVNFGMWAICLGKENLKDLSRLNELGIIGYKYFWGYALNLDNYQLVYNYHPELKNILPPLDDGEVYEIFEEVGKTNKMLAIHAENSALIKTLTNRYKNDSNNYEDLLKARPSLAEELTVQTGIRMAKETGARLHILHISSGKTVGYIKKAQEEGLPITGETCPHYLYLDASMYDELGNMLKVFPPIKYKEDQELLWEGLQNGTITSVCSDHAPHTAEDKQLDLWEAPAGMCGVQHLVPLMLDAVSTGKISLNQLVSMLSYKPALEHGIASRKGVIRVGSDADITIVDLSKETVIRTKDLLSKSKVTAFDGFRVKGLPVYTIVNGHVVMEDGQVIETLKGQFIKA
ncbi:dihydroorotase family protein [Lysinibacillus telephonicus]|uniref:Allantoinase n=1 Tax=Lysinibacillus telephonicus TaxID=1714840 RepID=A0A431UUU7_9BACI|nr:dihydroorotase family protein [Lysinibacillus telephonicus]RTQ94328.1 allantoinase [Lysinibacillus telephonicus]